MNAILALILRVLFLILTYVFVGWIGYTIYKDLQALFHNQKEKLTSPMTLRAVVNQEPLEKQFSITEIIIGRDPDCDFTISDETISVRHCKLSHHHNQWWVTDLGSTNGSFINDTPVDSPIIITEGDELRLGQVSINIQINQ
jgi:pSer/pThr/pTyr-binding forkhead associated (FHA) protein